MDKKRVLSGVQPTGALHIGNWLGAINNWVELQSTHQTFFCVVDLHAITVPHDKEKLAQDTLSTAALYIACGIDPNVSSIFVQSHIPEHSELCWLLNCLTPLNWMERMIQFKEKSIKQGDNNVSVGLMDYPILMAADILLYDADLVPVGEDQKQHLELARNIAQQRVNARFANPSQPILKVPEPLIIKQGSKIMSLLDGSQKMSKSDKNDGSRITLLDPPDLIVKKIKRAKTDAKIGLEFDNPNRPEANNLLGIYSLLTGNDRDYVSKECADMGWGTFKPLLAEATVSAIEPIQKRYYELIQDKTQLQEILYQGSSNASKIATSTLYKIREALGFLQSKKFN